MDGSDIGGAVTPPHRPADRLDRVQGAVKRPLTSLVGTIQDGRFLRVVFLGMLALTVGTVAQDYSAMLASAPEGQPGLQRIEPTPMDLPKPGDQTRPYLPRTMPLGPDRGRPDLPGYRGPLDGPAMSQPMEFAVLADGRASAVGTSDPGSATRFEEFLADNDKQIGELTLHSPGGSVADALSISRAIRAAGISTRVSSNGYCASSCPLLLAGGLYRSAGENAYIGVHQVYAAPTANGTLQRGMADAQTVSALCQQLLVDMGVDLKVWVRAIETPAAQLYLFTPDELSRYGLANGRRAVTRPERREPIDGDVKSSAG